MIVHHGEPIDHRCLHCGLMMPASWVDGDCHPVPDSDGDLIACGPVYGPDGPENAQSFIEYRLTHADRMAVCEALAGDPRYAELRERLMRSPLL